MKTRFLMLAGAALLAAVAPVAAQETVGVPPPNPDGWHAPKTAWGDPDLRGQYPLDQVGRTPMQRRPQYGNRLAMTAEEYAEAVRQAAEVAGGADREDASNTLGAGNWFEYGTALRQTALVVEPAETGRIPALTEEGQRRVADMQSTFPSPVLGIGGAP